MVKILRIKQNLKKSRNFHPSKLICYTVAIVYCNQFIYKTLSIVAFDNRRRSTGTRSINTDTNIQTLLLAGRRKDRSTENLVRPPRALNQQEMIMLLCCNAQLFPSIQQCNQLSTYYNCMLHTYTCVCVNKRNSYNVQLYCLILILYINISDNLFCCDVDFCNLDYFCVAILTSRMTQNDTCTGSYIAIRYGGSCWA